MEFSIRDVRSRFTEAADAAARGERVVVTKHGRPFIELVAARPEAGMDFEKAALVRQALGFEDLVITLEPEFDDPAFSRHVLRLDD